MSTESNVPRHEGQNLTTIPETDQQYSSQNHFTTDPVDAVTAQMSNASIGSELNVPQPQANVTPKNHYRKEFAKGRWDNLDPEIYVDIRQITKCTDKGILNGAEYCAPTH